MKKKGQAFLFCLVLLALLVLLAACGGNADLNQPPESEEGASGIDGGAGEQPDAGGADNQAGGEISELNEEEILANINTNWGSSPHAAAFVLDDEGNNNRCARCHSPINWQPSLDDLPASCFSCKFELEDPDPLIIEKDWLDIPCMVCHEVGKKDKVKAEYKWLEIAQLEEYSEVDSTTELCQKCHESASFDGHGGIQELGVHQDFTCTSCHDAHSTQASCQNSGCHEDVQGLSPGHTEEHGMVTCEACHDASMMELSFREDGFFAILEIVESDSGVSTFFFSSHNIQRESNCDRCHFSENEWGLVESVEE